MSTAAPGKQFGKAKTIDVTVDLATFLSFDLSTLPAGTTGRDVTAATLRVWVNKLGSPAAFDVVPVTAPWSESNITGATAPATGAAVGTGVVAASNAFVTVDVTALAKDWVDGVVANNGVALQANGALSARFDSKENKTTGHEPTLEITLAGVHATDLNNTFAGPGAGASNTTGDNVTAFGFLALNSNTTGFFNTAFGSSALPDNTTGFSNTAVGLAALSANTTGFSNTAIGSGALGGNDTGSNNTAVGVGAMSGSVHSGGSNTALGTAALNSNATGFYNTALGSHALYSSTSGSYNIAIGRDAGFNLTSGSGNILIAHDGVASESDTIRLGSSQTRAFVAGVRGVTTGVADAIPVMVDSNGQLGTISSSRRFKEDIHPMGDYSEALLELRPVTFRYTSDLDPSHARQSGLIAEEVAKVMPDLVVYDAQGRPETVRYHLLATMAVNELQKQARQIEVLSARLQRIEAALDAERSPRIAEANLRR